MIRKKWEYNEMLIVEQVASSIRCPSIQRATLIGLGLNKMHRRRRLQDTPSIRGLIKKVRHLVSVIDVKSSRGN